MRLELWVAWRYFITRQRERFVSILSIISILGIAIGVMALIGTLGVMTGFGNQLREKIIGGNPHISIKKGEPMTDFSTTEKIIKGLPHVKSITENIQGQAFFYAGNRGSFLLVKGINPATEAQVTQIKQYVKKGTFFIKKDEIIVGNELAKYLGLSVGDSFSLESPITADTKMFKVAGIFNSEYYEYDSNLVLVTIEDAQELFDLDHSVTEIGASIDDPRKAQEIKRAIANAVGPDFKVSSWMDINKSLLSALELEKIVMFLVVALVVLVASFNIASTLIVTVTKKTRDIGILKSIGAMNMSIAQIFAFGGLLIGFLGILLGVAGGLLVCYGIKNIHRVIEIPKDIYYFDRVPVALNSQDIMWIATSAVLICFVSTIYPAWKASRLHPVTALRYE